MIVITTPTGNIGRQVLENIINSKERIRVIARDSSRIPLHIRQRVEIVSGSHDDIEVVNRAFAGADAILWVVPPNPHASSFKSTYVDFTRPASEAFRREGVKRVVGVSSLGRETAMSDRAGLVSAAFVMDDLIMNSGVSYRSLAAPSFMENLLRQIEPIKKQSMFFSPIDGDLKAPTCATRDIAAVAARLLLDSSWSGQDIVPVLGPEDLSHNDMARIMSEVLGKPISFQQTTFDALKTQLKGLGMSDAFIEGYIEMAIAKNEGLDNAQARTAQSSSPTSFRVWCEEVLKPAVLN